MSDDTGTITTEITATQYRNGERLLRTTQTIQGDASGATYVPSVAEARAELKDDWATFDALLASAEGVLSRPQRDAIGEAAAAIEGSNRQLATAYLLEAAAALHDDGIGAFFVVPRSRQRRAPAAGGEESDEAMWERAEEAINYLQTVAARLRVLAGVKP